MSIACLCQAVKDERAKAGIERLQLLLSKVQAAPVAAESKAVQDLDASLKQADKDWKEIGPIYDKWQAGRHSFRSNADLQAFKRRYEECNKIRQTGGDKLHEALCARRAGKAFEASDEPRAGWSSTARKPTLATAPRASVNRGEAAVALDASAKKKASAKSSSWASQTISFAQRLRAEAVARVRQEVDAPEDTGASHTNDDGFWNESLPERPPPPPVPEATQDVDEDGFKASKTSKSSRVPTAQSKAPLSSLANGGVALGLDTAMTFMDPRTCGGRRWGSTAAALPEDVEEDAQVPSGNMTSAT